MSTHVIFLVFSPVIPPLENSSIVSSRFLITGCLIWTVGLNNEASELKRTNKVKVAERQWIFANFFLAVK